MYIIKAEIVLKTIIKTFSRLFNSKSLALIGEIIGETINHTNEIPSKEMLLFGGGEH